jgi:hypothetical protein
VKADCTDLDDEHLKTDIGIRCQDYQESGSNGHRQGNNKRHLEIERIDVGIIASNVRLLLNFDQVNCGHAEEKSNIVPRQSILMFDRP